MFNSADYVMNTSFNSACTEQSVESEVSSIYSYNDAPPAYHDNMQTSFYGYRTRHLSCIEEQDSDAYHETYSYDDDDEPFDFMNEADETFKKMANADEKNITWDADDIAILDESQIYKIEPFDEVDHKAPETEQADYWQSTLSRPCEMKNIPDIMTQSCYGALNSPFTTPVKDATRREPIYATPDKRRDLNMSFTSQSSSIYEHPSMTSSIDLTGMNMVSTPLELSVLSIDGSRIGWTEDKPGEAAKHVQAAKDDLQSIRRLLEHETSGSACPSCHSAYDKGKRRKLIDTCGHERCYTCMFRNEQCPMCMNSSLKDVDCSNAQGYDTGIGGSTSTIVSPLGSPQPQVRSQIRTNAANGVYPKYMQHRQESISPDLRYASFGKHPKAFSAVQPSHNDIEVLPAVATTAPSFATPPPTRRKFFNHKNLKSALTGHRRTASNGGCPVDTSSILSANPPNLMDTSTCSDSVVTRRRKSTISQKLSGNNRLSLAGTSQYAGHISSMVYGKIKSLWSVHISSDDGLNLLAGGEPTDPKASTQKQQKDELRTRLGLLLDSSLRLKQPQSGSSTNISPQQTLTGSSEIEAARFKPDNDIYGSQLSIAIKDDISIPIKFKTSSTAENTPEVQKFPRKTVVRRSARSAPVNVKNRNAVYKPVQLALRPLFFEVPLQEPDPPFIGRQWLLRELSNVLTGTETPGVLINGSPGTGKTALILQLVEYSCFGRRQEVAQTEADGIYCQINIGHDRIKALASHIVGYHFCQADNNSTCQVPDFVHSIAAQLCQAPQLIAYREYLLNESHLQDILSIKECVADPERVLRMAVLEPLSILKRSGKIAAKNCIILVDALCEAEYHRPDHGHTIATFLAKMTQYFPSWLKVISTVRTQRLHYVKGLSYTKMTLDSWASNDLLQKDMLDYIIFRVNHSTTIQSTIGAVKDNSTGQLKFVTHLQALAKGSFLYAKSILDLIERGQLVVKSTSYKVLPISLAQIFLLHFNLRFPTSSSFEKAEPILSVCLAALYPLTLNEIYYSICCLNTDEPLEWGEFLQRFKLLDGFLVKRLDNSYMFFHPSFREWLVRRDDGESSKFICDIQKGHAAIAFRLSRLQAPLDSEKTLELGHHLNAARVFTESTSVSLPSREMLSIWLASVTDTISGALCSLRNVYSPNLRVTRLLLSAGASPHATTEFLGDATVICIAAHEGIVPMVSLLIEYGADVERTNSQGCTPLILAAIKGHCDVVRLLVGAGSFLGQTDTTQRCALVHAARMGRLSVVKYLLACRWKMRDETTDVTRDVALQQAIVAAAAQGHTTIIEDLLEDNGDCINEVDILSGETPLTAAAKTGCSESLSMLLPRGARVDGRNKHGMTPLRLAVKHGHWAVADKLLQNGADIQECNPETKKTPLMIAAEEGHIPMLELLIDRGASLEAEDSEGFTAFSWACLRGKQAAAKCLIDKGCNREHEDKNRRKALDLAAYQGSANLVQFLLDNGASIEHFDANGMRPLDRAIACRNIQVVQIFLKRGAKLGPTTWAMAAGKSEILIILLNKLLEDGNVLYRKNRYDDASHRYQYALKKIANIDNLDKISLFVQLRANLMLNLSRCKRKLHELVESIDLATQAIDTKPSNYEGYYARARSHMDNGDYNEALADANEAMQKAAQSGQTEVLGVLKRLQSDLLARISEANMNCNHSISSNSNSIVVVVDIESSSQHGEITDL